MGVKEVAKTLGLLELRRSERALWRELNRHDRNHGCEDFRGAAECPVHRHLIQAWIAAQAYRAAIEWVLGLVEPEQLPYSCQSDWSGEWFPITSRVREARERAAAKESR